MINQVSIKREDTTSYETWCSHCVDQFLEHEPGDHAELW